MSPAAAVWLHDRGPALFTQVRVGKDGHAFRIYKFRTMVVDAEQRKAQLLESNDSDGVLFKLRRDPRVTAVGVAPEALVVHMKTSLKSDICALPGLPLSRSREGTGRPACLIFAEKT